MTTDLTGYAGRTVALAAAAGPDRLSGLAGPTGRGLAVAGPQKLADRVAVTLFTPAGSQRARPGRGTTFLSDAWAGLWQTPGDVRQSFAAARLDLLAQLRAEESADDPADERLGDVALASASLAGGAATVGLEVSPLAGPPVRFLVPVPVTPR